MQDFVGAKFYCPHALADGNQRIRISEKTLEFSSTVLSTLSVALERKNEYMYMTWATVGYNLWSLWGLLLVLGTAMRGCYGYYLRLRAVNSQVD